MEEPNPIKAPQQGIGIKILLLVLVIGACIAFLRLTTQQTDRDKGVDADGVKYITMAGDTLFPQDRARIAPFCYRVATPWIAAQMPGTTYLAKFQLIAFIDAVLILVLAFLLLRALGFAYWSSLIGMLLYGGVFWTVKFTFFSAVYIDHMTQVFSLLIMLCMVKRWWFLLPVLVFGAYFQKESVAALVPFILAYYLHQRGWKWLPLYITGFLLLAAVAIPYLILRNNVHPINPLSPMLQIAEHWKVAMTRPGYAGIMIVAIVSGLGILPLIVLSQLRWVLGYLRHNPYWIVMLLTGVVLLFGGLDKARLFLHMLPAMVVLTIAVLEHLHRLLPPWHFRIWVAAVLILHTILGSWFTNFDSFVHYLGLHVPEWSPDLGAAGFSRLTVVAIVFLLANFVLLRPLYRPMRSENQA